jgi:thiol-disulfide isomerase/thioredoxin
MATKPRRPAIRLAFIAAIPLSALVALRLVAAIRATDEPGSAVRLSGPMPSLEGPALVEGRVDPALYRGKVVVVNFWASWCGPCRREQPGLHRLWEEYQARGVQFIGVNFKDDPAAARAYVDEFGVTYPSVTDPSGVLVHRFGVPYIPTTILAGVNGEMRYRVLGAQTEATLRRYIEELVAPTG